MTGINLKSDSINSGPKINPRDTMVGSTDINSVTNDLLLKYDKKFNELYNVKLKLNSSITNKEELIIQLNDNNENNDLIIALLKWLLSVFTVLILLYFFYKLKVFSLNTITLLFILIVLVYIFYGYNIYKTYSANMFDKQLLSMKVNMNPYAVEISNLIPQEEAQIKQKCKAACPSGQTKNPDKKSDTRTNSSVINNTLKTDSQLNVWEYGDIPDDLWNGKHIDPITHISSNNITSEFTSQYDSTFNQKFNSYDLNNITNPKARFGTTSPSMTYYKCNWMGDKNDDNNTYPFKSKLIYSSIPCEYKPNYTESGRYICKKNPNSDSINNSNFKDFCDDVSLV